MGNNLWTESYGEGVFESRGNKYDMEKLGMDQFYMTVKNRLNYNLYLYEKYVECAECPFLPLTSNEIAQEKTLVLSSRQDKIYRLQNSTGNGGIELLESFGEFGVYSWSIYQNGTSNFETLKEPVNIYFPILTVALIYSAVFLLLVGLVKLWNKYGKKSQDPKTETGGRARVKSLDTFRGISIVLMIFVNYGHGGYPFLEHALWNGLYIGDLVFPFFMWIMGVCIPMSIKSVLKRNTPKLEALKNILRRSCILFALGIFLGSGTNLEKLRIMGVLQRFAICYFVVASLTLVTMKIEDRDDEGFMYGTFKDILSIQLQWTIMIGLLLVYLLLIFFWSPPGCPPDVYYFGPGGNDEGGKFEGCTGGVAGYVDRVILGDHLYQWAEIREVYKAQAFDPEGIIGCLSSIFHVFLGLQGGIIMLVHKNHVPRIARWLIWAAITGLLGGILCDFSKDGGVIPVNKNLWSLSFVLVTSCFAFVLLSVCYILIDVKSYWSGKPFLFAGMNAIVMYSGHMLTGNNFPFVWQPTEKGHRTHFTALLSNVMGTSVWVLVAYIMFRKKKFISI